MRRLPILTLVFAASLAVVRADGPYSKIAEIPIGGAGSFDYLSTDGGMHRLFVSHGTEVVAIDTTTNKVIGTIPDTPGVHGFAIAPDLNRGFSSNGRENKVSVVDLKTLATIVKIETGGANPDAIMSEPTRKEVWAFNHTGKSVGIIDAKTNTLVATVPLGGTAETGQADASIGRVFVNIEDTDSVEVIDMVTRKNVAKYPVAPAEGPTGMAVDEANHHLFVGGGKFVVMMDTRTGKVLSSAAICSGTDATFYDPGSKTVFASCGDGHISAATVSGDTLKAAYTFETAPRARTMTLDPVTHRIYVAGVKLAPADPAKPTARPAALPDSLFIAVFGTSK